MEVRILSSASDGEPGGSEATFPHSTGSRRIQWSMLPHQVHAGIERILGWPVAVPANQPGGFSDGLAARLMLRNGRRAFVKAIDSVSFPAVGEFHRREITIAGGLPPAVPAPRLLGSYDDGAWVALVFEDVEGALPAQPWRPDQLDRVLDAVIDLAERLTPAPMLETAGNAPRLGGWSRLAENPTALAKLGATAPWVIDNLDTHLSLEVRLDEVAIGDTLVHGDLYPFNILLTASRVVFVDWSHAWIGAKHADLVMLLGSVALSGIDPEPFAKRHPLLVQVDPDALNTLISAQSGFLLDRAFSSGPNTDPHFTRMMIALGLSSLRWLSTRRKKS